MQGLEKVAQQGLSNGARFGTSDKQCRDMHLEISHGYSGTPSSIYGVIDIKLNKCNR